MSKEKKEMYGIGHPSDVCPGLGKPPEDHTESRQHQPNPQMGILSL